MNVLLDTHTFLWLDSDAAKLSAVAMNYLTDPANRLLLSVVSVWEVTIKVAISKLTLRTDLATIVAEQTQRNPITVLPITLDHAIAVGGLPSIHKDPFDRLLVAQAIVESATLLTADPIFQQYPVQTAW